MSLDFCFWREGNGTSAELYEQAAEGDYSRFVSSQSVLDFRSEMISRWPDIEDSLEPLSHNPFAEEQEDLTRCVLITLSLGRSDLAPVLIDLASSLGLRGYDPQQETDL